MTRILSKNSKKTASRGIVTLLTVMFLIFNGVVLKAQNIDYHLGVRGGVGMSTLSGYENNGLKIGLTGGIYGKMRLSEHNSIIIDINYSEGGQLSEKWYEASRTEKIKIYSKYSLHYLNTPILYQYYFTDILGLEAGANFCYCIAGNLKTKVGNENWEHQELKYNAFDCGLIFGVYTDNLIPHEDVFVNLRAYFGFLDVVKDVGANKNVSVQITVGYMFL